MTGLWKRWKTKLRFPTFPTVPWKSPTPRFPHSHSADDEVFFLTHLKIDRRAPFGRWPEPKERSLPTQPRSVPLQAHPALETKYDFRLTSGLENAPRPSTEGLPRPSPVACPRLPGCPPIDLPDGVCLRLMPELLAAGVDLGGTKISAAVVNAAGAILRKIKQPVHKLSFQESVDQIAAVVQTAADECAVNPADLAGVGVSVPGIYNSSTGNAWAPRLWGWDQVPLREALEKVLPAPVTIDGNRAACVLGEQWLGAARGLSDVVYLAVGAGIGAGIITGGRLLHGVGDTAGSVGWCAINPQKKDLYKKTGCFEAEAAGPAVGRRAAARIALGERSIIPGLAGANPVTAEVVVEAARRGDGLAIRVLEDTTSYLAMGVANLISVLNPEAIILGGSLMEAGDLLLQPLRREVLEWAQPLAASHVRIELSHLGEDAGLLGAARLPLLARSQNQMAHGQV
jgi:glucokinase